MSQPEPIPLTELQNGVLDQLNGFPTLEEKIAFGLQRMRNAISQEGAPRFREFWDLRNAVLPLFKQNVNSAIRSKLWTEYVELTVEARRLKALFEEQSAFAAEQIDLAILALEQDIAQFEMLVQNAMPISFPSEPRGMAKKTESYNQIQRELNLLNALASRLNGLRQEVLKTEMRIRTKTKFFKRLSELGDHVFPKRKQLIEQVSGEFLRDIEQFVQRPFDVPFYVLRDEIKTFQAWSKLLTLNTETFTRTHLLLSECWDRMKAIEKTQKQAFQQKKQVWTENCATVAAKIADLKTQAITDLVQLDPLITEIEKEMREIDLGRDDVTHLRKELQALRNPLIEQQQKIEQEKFQQKKRRNSELKERILLLQKDMHKSSEELSQELEELRKEIAEVAQGKFEEHHFERMLRPIKDLIMERKEHALLSLSDDERHTLQHLYDALKERKKARAEIKENLENYRRALSASNLNFEKAIALQEQIVLEKERNVKANASIEEIEQKISQIESRC